MSSAEPPHEASQSGHDGGLKTVGCALSANQSGGGGTGLRDRSAAVDDRSGKAYIALH